MDGQYSVLRTIMSFLSVASLQSAKLLSIGNVSSVISIQLIEKRWKNTLKYIGAGGGRFESHNLKPLWAAVYRVGAQGIEQ